MSANREEEPSESLEEMDAHTIGNFLPDEDDFFAEVTGEVGHKSRANGSDDMDDCDLFSSVGGMELDGEVFLSVGQRDGRRDNNFSVFGEHPRGETLSRVLFVGNIDSIIEDYELRVLFEQYGDLRALHTSDKNRGFIMVSYYNISAAQNAVRALHGRLLKGRKLDIHYFIPNNSVGSPVNSFAERHQSFNLPPSARIISSSRPVGLQESRNPFEVIKTGIQSMPNLHPHSFPDYLDNFASGSPFKSSTTFSEMVSNGQKANEGFMMGNVRGVGVDGFNRGVIGSPINQGSHRANLSLWSNANTQQHNPSSGMMWPNSPSRGNIPSQRIPSVNAFSRASTVMANMASSPVHHHIGSAPTLNSPFWNRRHACVAESPESSRFHLGSHVSMGYPGSSPSHHMEIGSHKVFSHVGGNRTDANSKNVVLHSPRQVPHLFPGRSSMLSVSGSFGMPNERYRNLSHRRSESNSSNGENKLYELDVDRILHGEDIRTTLMIKNIPNKYTSKMLLAAIDEYCKGTYDFLYLPIDFKNKCNVGYAFINLTEPKNIVPLYKAFNGKKWEKFNSEKVASLAYGRIQGKSALIAHFQNSSLMNEDKRCRPILFHTAGPNAGDQEPFPVGSNIRSRPGKPRTSSSTENYTNLSNSYENREELPIGIDSI